MNNKDKLQLRIWFNIAFLISEQDSVQRCRDWINQHVSGKQNELDFNGAYRLAELKELYGAPVEQKLDDFCRELRLFGLPKDFVRPDHILMVVGFSTFLLHSKDILRDFHVLASSTMFPKFEGARITQFLGKKEWLKLPRENQFFPGKLEEVPKGYTPEYYIYNVGI